MPKKEEACCPLETLSVCLVSARDRSSVQSPQDLRAHRVCFVDQHDARETDVF